MSPAAATALDRRRRAPVTVLELRPKTANTLRGFTILQLASGMVLRDVAVHTKGGRWWASPPGRPVLDREGKQVTTHSGAKQFAATVGFVDRSTADRFSRLVIEALRESHPEIFAEDGP